MAMSMSQACERCWRRKQKCARDFPCLQCRTAAKECVRRRQGSIVDAFGAGGENYVEALKARIAFLKIRIDESGSDHGGNPESTPSNASASTPAQRPTPRERRDDMHSTIQEASYISLSAMAERTNKQRSGTKGLSFKCLLNAAIAASRKEAQTTSGFDNGNDYLGAVNDFFINGPCEAAFKTYVNHLRSTCPYIGQSRLYRAYQHTRSPDNESAAVVRSKISPEHITLVYLGLATGILLLPGHDGHEKDVDALIWYSLEALNHVLDNGDDLATVHCLIALTVCSLLSDKAGSTWHLLGLAMTRGVACGVHTAKELESDLQAESAEHVRVFWALYLLDTRVSSFLDRPFYLDGPTIAGFKDLDAEDDISLLVNQARILRSMRQFGHDTALSDFINLQHWHETTANQCSTEEAGNLQDYTFGLVELFKHSVVTSAFNSKMVITEAETVFNKYLVFLEDQLIAKTRVAASLDVPLVLAIGVIMCGLHAMGHIAQQKAAYQAINLLTLLSTRYSYARGFRDVLMECLMTSAAADPQQPRARLRELIDGLEVQIPSRIESIIFSRKPL